MHGTAQNNASPEYERARRQAIREYNTLLVDAKQRLQATLARVERRRATAQGGDVAELAARIRKLIEYLNEAGL